MKFKEKLFKGNLLKRYKRFFVDIKHNSKTITAHCPNSGSMINLLTEGNEVWFSKSSNPKRKLKYTLEMIKVNKKLVGVNTQLTNKIVLEALQQKKIKKLIKYHIIETEKKFSENTRFDFLLSNLKEKCFLEVKNVTLVRKSKIAEFPDSITARGTKHIRELINAKKLGYESFLLFLIQREDCVSFKIADDIDREYKLTLDKALKNGIKILTYDCKLNNKEIIINNQICYEK